MRYPFADSPKDRTPRSKSFAIRVLNDLATSLLSVEVQEKVLYLYVENGEWVIYNDLNIGKLTKGRLIETLEL